MMLLMKLISNTNKQNKQNLHLNLNLQIPAIIMLTCGMEKIITS